MKLGKVGNAQNVTLNPPVVPNPLGETIGVPAYNMYAVLRWDSDSGAANRSDLNEVWLGEFVRMTQPDQGANPNANIPTPPWAAKETTP
jgi:hypothetical protein